MHKMRINMPLPPKHHISFSPSDRSVDILPGTSLLEAAWMAGIRLASTCGGNGKCLQCRIIIRDGKTSPLHPAELKSLTEGELEEGYRLACCTFPLSDLAIHIPEQSLLTDIRLQLEGISGEKTLEPIIDVWEIHVQAPSPEDPRADLDRVKEGLENYINAVELTADIGSTRQLSSLLRENDWRVSSYVRSNEIIGFGPHGSPPLGVAIDLGTTKIAAYLMNLLTGRELAAVGALNPQARYGDDVMTRLRYAVNNADPSGRSPGKLAQEVRGTIRDMIAGLVEKTGDSLSQVADLCIVGNTAMTHLLLDLPVRQLAASPYVASVSQAIDIKARDLDIVASPGAYAHILPSIGGFVGADHIAMILATDIDRATGISLGIDIGTNTEIVLRRPDKTRMVSASCPSGPAFEGAHITDGIRAMKGAIESVKLTVNSVEYRTIGDASAIGLCGSGIIDAIAELNKWDLIDERGRFKKTNGRIIAGEQGLEFQVAQGDGKKGKGRIVIRQRDIDEIQLAKGAIRAGIAALLEVTGTSPDMVGEVILAGAFGSFINILNAVNINLLPWFPNARYKQVGNAAGQGAKMALVSKNERRRAQQISAQTNYLELTTHPGFNRLFADGMMFPKIIR